METAETHIAHGSGLSVKPVYVVSTQKGQYLCEVFLHPSRGFVWTQADGKMVNYAIPETLKTAKLRLQYQVERSFGGQSLVLAEVSA